jgi:hypothetical protein
MKTQDIFRSRQTRVLSYLFVVIYYDDDQTGERGGLIIITADGIHQNRRKTIQMQERKNPNSSSALFSTQKRERKFIKARINHKPHIFEGLIIAILNG